MTKLQWSRPGDKVFQSGLDLGVLYLDGRTGVPWNGLQGLEESSTDTTATGYYMEGIKYLNHVTEGEYTARLDAFTAPDEFDECDGTVELNPGFYAHQQGRTPFGLSYRNFIGDDIRGVEAAYKLHLVYNATAIPAAISRGSLSADPNLVSLSWDISAIPILLDGFAPTAHFTIDSRKTSISFLRAVENTLYGTVGNDARLPTPQEIMALYQTTVSLGTFTEFFEAVY